MPSRRRLSIHSLCLTFLSLVSLSNALQLSIQQIVHLNNETSIEWTVDGGKNVSFHLYLKSSDSSVFTGLGDVNVETDTEQSSGNVNSGTRSVFIQTVPQGTYHIAAYWSTDPTPTIDSNESGTSNDFQLTNPLPPPPPPSPSTTTQTSTIISSGSAITTVVTTTAKATTTASNVSVTTQERALLSTSQENSTNPPTIYPITSSASPTASPETGSSSSPQSTVTVTSSNNSSAFSTTGDTSTNTKSDTGLIIGSVVGALVGIILLIIMIVYFVRRYRQHRYNKSISFYQDMLVRPAENRGTIVHDDDAGTIVGEMVEKGYGTYI